MWSKHTRDPTEQMFARFKKPVIMIILTFESRKQLSNRKSLITLKVTVNHSIRLC